MKRSRPLDLPRLAERLEALRREWAGRRLDSDPLVFPHRYSDPADREVVAFLSASLAFGRVASIQASVGRALDALGPSPAASVARGDTDVSGFFHRWVTDRDLARFLGAIGAALRSAGSLKAFFAEGDAGGEDFVPALESFYERLRSRPEAGDRPTRGLRFLLPSPAGGSACKRAHLFLRWMVRRDGLDLGLWSGGHFSAARLLLPMDTHVHRISRYLGLTARNGADLSASREATAWLRRISPADPIAYDWALSRLGILAECVRERTRRQCIRCAVRPVCRVSLVPRDAPYPESSLAAAQ